MLTYIFWSASLQSNKALFQSLHVLAGLLSLATRQTNIFWVAVFLGGLQVVESVKDRLGPDKVHDSSVSEAYLEG